MPRKPRWRAARQRERKTAGILPSRRQWVWLVQPDALFPMPEWVGHAAVAGLGTRPGYAWLWPADAKRLIAQVQRAGWQCGRSKVELRHCSVCERPLMGHEAEQRRSLDESGPGGRLLPCGPQCRGEAVAGVWRKLNPYARMAGCRARKFRERQAA
jgi:hypothetical protein